MRGSLEKCSRPFCRRDDIGVIVFGPRGASVPVCFRCWERQPEHDGSEETWAKLASWYEEMGAKPPERGRAPLAGAAAS